MGAFDMKEEQRIFEELKKRANNSKHEQALKKLCQQMLRGFESKSSQGVTEIISAELKTLSDAYDDAHKTLMEKMGFAQGDSG